LHYHNYNGTYNPAWNHDLFNAFGLRSEIENNLIQIHPILNDSNNDFLNNIINDPNRVGGNYTLQNMMYYLSWIGLEDTQAYLNTFNNNSIETTRVQYTESAVRTHYTNNCIN
jgi:hypothetical protein